MTCILFANGYVAVDSNHQLPGTSESYISPSKLVAFDAPMPLHIATPADWRLDGEKIAIDIAFTVDDRIHGYTVTGSTTHAQKFIEDWKRTRLYSLEKKLSDLGKLPSDTETDPEVLFEKAELSEDTRREIERHAMSICFASKYHAVHRLGHRYDEEGFTLILIGEKGCYRYRPHLEGTAVFDMVPPMQGHAYGSGCEVVFEYFRQYSSHVLAIYATMLVDAGTAGFVEVWKLPSVEKPELYREGMWNPRTKDQIRALLKEGDEPVADMINPKSARILAQMYFDAGAFLGTCPEGLRLHRKMASEDPALAEHSVRLFGRTDDPKSLAVRDVFMKDWKAKGWLMRPPIRPKAASKKARPLHDKQVNAIQSVKRKLKRTPSTTVSKRKKA